MKPITIIGMGMSLKDLTQHHLEVIGSAEILIGGKRHLEFFKAHPAIKKPITKDIAGLIHYIRSEARRKTIVVLTSGDPMFYGVGVTLCEAIGKDNVRIYPNITSVAAAFAKIGEPWQDVRVISLHGRKSGPEFIHEIQGNDSLAVLTDAKHNPSWIAQLLIKNRLFHYKLCVCEQLGTDAEKVAWVPLEKASGMAFTEPNIVVLKRIQQASTAEIPLQLGMDDESFDHEAGLITKPEVRAVVLSKLRLLPGIVMWDLGAGSGSVSIEAALFIKNGKLFAVEKTPERIHHIQNNKKRFKVRNLEIVEATLPKGLETLPPPDRIFIGGGGKDLQAIVNASLRHLKPGGVIVINTVLIANLEIALQTLKKEGLSVETIQIQISRAKKMPWGERFEAQNPVWIMTGQKQGEIR